MKSLLTINGILNACAMIFDSNLYFISAIFLLVNSEVPISILWVADNSDKYFVICRATWVICHVDSAVE